MPAGLTSFLDWLRGSANDWAPAIQAIAAVAALAVAAVATVVARRAQKAEEKQARAADEALKAANAQIEQARRAEIARSREVEILAVQPPIANSAPQAIKATDGPNAGFMVARIACSAPGSGPALSVRAAISRADLAPDPVEVGSFAPSKSFVAELPIKAFYDVGSPDKTSGEPHDVRLEWQGLLGQRVVEHYLWFIDPAKAGSQPLWAMRRLEIVPATVGAEPINRALD